MVVHPGSAVGRYDDEQRRRCHFFPRSDRLHSNLNMLLLSQIWVLPECPKLLMPILGKLRLVNLENLPGGCDIAWTMFILEAAPVLKDLGITVWDHWCIMVTDKEHRKASGYCDNGDVEWKPSTSNFKHKNLAKLTIYGFQADDNFIRYVKRVMLAAVNLEEISLHDRKEERLAKMWNCW
uniref:FBD domain-containing protein n=1 Tax=Aegilops tauschii TaxID=37682 RepID=M8CXP1_AEGTA